MTDPEGPLMDIDAFKQSQSDWPESDWPNLQSPIWNRIIAKEPNSINILFTAPHSAQTAQC